MCQSIWFRELYSNQSAHALSVPVLFGCIRQFNAYLDLYGQRRNIHIHFSECWWFHIETESIGPLAIRFSSKVSMDLFYSVCRECVHMRAIKLATPLFKCNKRKSICLSVCGFVRTNRFEWTKSCEWMNEYKIHLRFGATASAISYLHVKINQNHVWPISVKTNFPLMNSVI